MNKCGDCIHFKKCEKYTDKNETYAEVGGCKSFVSKMPDKKLTDSKIVKALEYCSQQGTTSECERCKVKGCRSELIKLALDLINRLQAENERLTIRLRKTEHQLDDAMKMYNIIKAEAYKEFAELLFKKAERRNHNSEYHYVLADDIVDLLKELVGDSQ